jgi:hypothetical protein
MYRQIVSLEPRGLVGRSTHRSPTAPGGVNLLCVGILARSPDPSRKIWLFSARGQGVHLLQSDGFYFPFHRFGWELDLIASQEDFSLAYGLPGRVLNCGESARVSACLAEIRTVPWCRRK